MSVEEGGPLWWRAVFSITVLKTVPLSLAFPASVSSSAK